jgi:hypothetical protein
MNEDFIEYKKKEDSKWKSRAQSMGFRFPIFSTLEEFKQDLKDSPVVVLTPSLRNKVQNLTSVNNFDDLRSMVSSYKRPRDLDRIVNGMKNGHKIPMPIILRGRRGMFIMAGNTRQNSAYILDEQIKVLMVDVND